MISEFHSKPASGSLSDLGNLQRILKENLDRAGVTLEQPLMDKYTRIVAMGSYFEGASDVMRDRGSAAFAVPSGNKTFRLSRTVDELELLDGANNSLGVIDNLVIYAEKGLNVERSMRFDGRIAVIDFALTDISPGRALSTMAAGTPLHNGVRILVHDLVEDHSRGYLKDPALSERLRINVTLNGRPVSIQ